MMKIETELLKTIKLDNRQLKKDNSKLFLETLMQKQSIDSLSSKIKTLEYEQVNINHLKEIKKKIEENVINLES